MSSSAFCIDAAASTVMWLPCVDGGDATTIAYNSPVIAASMSVISSPGSSRSNCIRGTAGSAHNYIQFVRVSQEQLSADGEVSRCPPWVPERKHAERDRAIVISRRRGEG